jgi:hypothetical protein
MKTKVTVVLVCALWLISAIAAAWAEGRSVGPSQPAPDPTEATDAQQASGCVEVSLIESSEDLIGIEYRVGDFTVQEVRIGEELHHRVTLAGESRIMEKGMPDLPVICRSIIIPDGAKMDVKVTESSYREYKVPIAPSRGHISRDVNPDHVPYEFSSQYSRDGFYPGRIAELGSPYILRDFRGITVKMYPFAYNPGTQTLRVYTRVVLEVRGIGPDIDNVKVRRNVEPNKFFAEIYKRRFLNYSNSRYESIEERGRMIVISHADFIDAMQPYVDWKRQKGIWTDLYDVAGIGSTEDDIRAFIQTEYDAGDGLALVQLVGDYGHIPTFLIARDFCDGLATSDASYALLEGSDSYPDILVSRFSASTVADIETQVERTVHYEKELEGGDWLQKGTGVGSAWGDGYGYMGLSDRDLVEVLRLMLLGYTYTDVDQLYELGEPPFGIIPVEVSDFMDAINEGKSIVNIEGHADCEATFMIPPGTPSGDRFTTDSVYSLTNDYMLPFMFIGAPYLGNFQIDLAFPEAWLRATNGTTGAPIGAIAVYASSTDLDYASPQAAQYEMTELLVAESFNTFGGLMYNGACYAVDLYGSRGEKTLLSYNAFGDVSLQVRTDTPEPMTVLHESTIASGSLSFEVTVFGIEDALCAISRDYELLGAAYTDAGGQAVIEFDDPITVEAKPLDLVVTAYNKRTYTAEVAVYGVLCGDANASGGVDVDDAVYLIAYVFSGGPPPDPLAVGDVDCSGAIDIDDIVHLVAYIFSGGNVPCDADGDGLLDC